MTFRKRSYASGISSSGFDRSRGQTRYHEAADGIVKSDADWVTLSTPTLNSGAVTHHPFQEEIDNLVSNIYDNVPVLSDVLDACNSVEVVMAIEESAATGRPVTVTGLRNLQSGKRIDLGRR